MPFTCAEEVEEDKDEDNDDQPRETEGGCTAEEVVVPVPACVVTALKVTDAEEFMVGGEVLCTTDGWVTGSLVLGGGSGTCGSGVCCGCK